MRKTSGTGKTDETGDNGGPSGDSVHRMNRPHHTTDTEPLLPPVYRLVRLTAEDSPFGQACAAAETGEDGDFFWCDRPDRLECAILLHPELPADRATVLAYTAMVGLGDAVGALAPPAVAVEFGWPDKLLVNGALAGGIRIATAATSDAGAVPSWQVLGITVAIHGDRSNASPGLRQEVTTLFDEGAVEITTATLAESVSRHLLAWIHRWQEDGFAPVCDSWLARAEGYRQEIAWQLQDGPVAGRFVGLDDRGGLLLARSAGGATDFTTVALAPALHHPNWSL